MEVRRISAELRLASAWLAAARTEAALSPAETGRSVPCSCIGTGLLRPVCWPLFMGSGCVFLRLSSMLITCMCVLGPEPAVTHEVAPPYCAKVE